MVKSSDPNYHDVHDFHKEKTPTRFLGANFRKLVFQIIEEHGSIQRKELIRQLDPDLAKESEIPISQTFIYKRVHHELKELKKKKLIRLSNGWIHLGGTLGGPQDFGETPDSEMFHWLEQPYFYHNIQGKIEVEDYGNLTFPKDTDVDPLACGGYVRIMRQYSSLQFWFAYDSPGFEAIDFLVCFEGLRDLMVKHGIKGKIMIQQFEVRNERNDVIHYLKRVQNPVQEKLIKGFIARAYYDKKKDKTKFEFRVIKELSVGEFTHVINQMSNTAKYLSTADIFSKSLTRFESKYAALHDNLTKSHEQTLMYATETQTELMKVQQETEFNNNIMTGLFEQNNNISGQIKTVFDQVKLGVEGPQRIEKKVEQIQKDITEVKDQMKENYKEWLDLNKKQRIEIIQRFHEISEFNYQQMADYLNSTKATIYKWIKRNLPHIIEDRKLKSKDGNYEVPKILEKPKEIDNQTLFDEYEVSIMDPEDNQVLKVLQKLKSGYSSDFISILSHIKESNVRRSLSRITANHENIKSRKVNGKKIYYLEES